jgi:DNA-binding MarR family transcriptional regulator
MQGLRVDAITDAVLAGSRALVAVAARSLASVHEDVTLPQYRVLVVLCARGPLGMGELADELGCSGSTATRLCDRLVARALVDRHHRLDNRRQVEVHATQTGVQLVRDVTARRRAEIDVIVANISPRQRSALAGAFRAFADAAGEVPDQAWSTGWEL